MKKTKKLVLQSLTLGFVATLAAGVIMYTPADTQASAQTNGTSVTLQESTITINGQSADSVSLTVGETVHTLRFDTQDGASIRLGVDVGLRFYSFISQADLEALGDTYGKDNVEFGSIVTTKDKYDTLENFTIGAEGVQTVPAANRVLVEDSQTSEAARDGIARFNVTVKENNQAYYATDVVARGYVKVTKDGTDYVAYTNAEDNTRSLSTVANKALRSNTAYDNATRVQLESFTAEQKTDTIVLQKNEFLPLALGNALNVNVDKVYDVTTMQKTENATAISAPVADTYLSTMDTAFAATAEDRSRTLSVYTTDGEIYRVNTVFASKVIRTADDLLNWTNYAEFTSDDTYTGYVTLGANIDLSGKTITNNVFVRNKSKGFQGTFDGNGYTISGGTYGAGGLFGTLGQNGVLKNVAIQGAKFHMRTWVSADTQCDAVIADYTTGTIDNCVIDAQGTPSDGQWSHGFLFGAQLAGATISNTVLYNERWNAATYWQGFYLADTVDWYTSFNNVYLFAKAGDNDTNIQRNYDGTLIGINNYVWNTIGNERLSDVKAYNLDVKLSDTINEVKVGEDMATKLTAAQWDFTGDKVAFQSKSAASNPTATVTATVNADYSKYTGFDDEEGFRESNIEGIIVTSAFADGDVQIFLDGTLKTTVAAKNNSLTIPCDVAQGLPYGDTLLVLKDSSNALTTVNVTVWSKLISTAEELLNWKAFTDKTEVVTASEVGKSVGYYTYNGYIGLAADIDLTGKTIESDCWIMDAAKGFQGTFDGRGYTISGGTYGAGGLFGTLGQNGVLKNVAFVGGKVTTVLWGTVGTNDSSAMYGNAVTANYTYGTVENCIFDVILEGVEGNGGHGGWLFGAKCEATIDKVVIYSINWQQPTHQWSLNYVPLFNDVSTSTFTNSYAFIGKGGLTSDSAAATGTTDEDAQAMIANSGHMGEQQTFASINGLTTYAYQRKLSDTVGEVIVRTEMATTLTGDYWDFSGDKVAFKKN